MRLFGKYNFDTMRDCLQGYFSFRKDGDEYVVHAWLLRVRIVPDSRLRIDIKSGNDYINIGNVAMTKDDT